MNRQYDVLIAGGGPAGLSAACAAAAAGLRVAVFERSKEIGYPIHTSGGSWLQELRALGIPEKFMHPIRAGRFLAPSAEASFSYREPVACILDIRELYQHLALRAAQAGAEIHTASPVEGIFYQHNLPAGLTIQRQGRFYAPLLIDASGLAGVLARGMGLRQEFQRYGLGAEVDAWVPQWPRDTIALLFGSLAARGGYGWIFPHGDERVRIGIGVIRPDSSADPRDRLQQLMRHPPAGIFNRGAEPISAIIETHFGAIPSVPPLSRTSTTGLLVVGDAAGLLSTLLGEGIRFAIELGRLAGEVAVQSHQAGRSDADFLQRFDRAWRRRYGRMFARAEKINRRLAKYDDAKWNERISQLAKLPPEMIPSLLKGDWHNSQLWRALWQQRQHLRPPFVKLFSPFLKRKASNS